MYVARRLLEVVPVLLAVTFIVFFSVRLVPGDPARAIAGLEADDETVEAVRRELGLDRPVLSQYGTFLVRAVRGDLGKSYYYGTSVTQEVFRRFPATLFLAASGIALSILIGMGIGVFSAVNRGTFFDRGTLVFAIIGVSMPSFWLGLMFIILFAVKLNWLPAGGYGTWRHLLLPALTLGLFGAGTIARLTRSSMLEVLQQDYVRTARAKGLPWTRVVLRHALRSALIPIITVLGLQFGAFLSRAVVTETVFGWPGIARLVVVSVLDRDFPLIQGTVLWLAVLFLVLNLLVDLIYSSIDPRIRYD
ncbi:MAG: ABC transporter permease [Trueperaceae bacterium]|nr:MAG: ABC transporter permease [Trueperaceae bacterium]